jgi:VanZ family protein
MKRMDLMKWKIGLVAYCCLILWVSSLAPKELPEQAFAVPDYIMHLVEYALLGVLAWAAFGGSGSGFPWGLFAFCVCFGITDECWQDWWSKGRSPEVWDAAMDAAGAFVGLLCSMVFWKR